MAKGGSRFSLRPGRKKDQLKERKLILILTEGATEETYFSHFRSTTGPDIEVVDKGDARRSIVEKAIKARAAKISDGSYDSDEDDTWVVFDRDIDAQNSHDRGQINEALDLAKQNNIKVAYSNDSFELWFLLHFQDVSSALHRRVILEKLEQRLGRKYIKGKGGDLYHEILSNLPAAVQRAKRMLAEAEAQGIMLVDANPSTTVHFLVADLCNNAGHPFEDS